MKQTSYSLESPRLVLFQPDVSHSSQILEYVKEARLYHKQWAPARDGLYFSLKHQQELLRKKDPSTIRMVMVKKLDTDKIIGEISVSNIIMGAFCSCFLGYGIIESESGKGYTTEALLCVIDYLFNKEQLHRVEANVMPENSASVRVLEKLGFTNDGPRKKYLKINGRWEDHISFSMVKEDFLGLK